MGKPINKKWFGDQDKPGNQIQVTAKLPGEPVGAGKIISQDNAYTYTVDVNGVTGRVKLVNTLTPGNLVDGEAFLEVTPFGKVSLAAYKLQQYSVSVYDELDVATSGYTAYKWGSDSAAKKGEATAYGADGYIVNPIDLSALSNFPILGQEASVPQMYNPSDTLPSDDFPTSDGKIVSIETGASQPYDGSLMRVIVYDVTGETPVFVGSSKPAGVTRSMGHVGDTKSYVAQMDDSTYIVCTYLNDSVGSSPKLCKLDINLSDGSSTATEMDISGWFGAATIAEGGIDRNICVVALDSTRFSVVFADDGVESSVANGSMKLAIYNTSFTPIMGPTLIRDLDTAANRTEYGAATSITAPTSDYVTSQVFNPETREITLKYSYDIDASNSYYAELISFRLSDDYSTIEQIGSPRTYHDPGVYGSSRSSQMRRINNDCVLICDVAREPNWHCNAFIARLNHATLDYTFGEYHTIGNIGIELASDMDILVLDEGTAYIAGSSFDINIGFTAGDFDYTVPFAGTNQSKTRFVNGIVNAPTDWPTYSGVVTDSVDGQAYMLNGAGGYTLLTTNTHSDNDTRGTRITKLLLDVDALTVNDTEMQMLTDGRAPYYIDASTPTHLYGNSARSNTLVPVAGKYAFVASRMHLYGVSAPYYTQADYNAFDNNEEYQSEAKSIYLVDRLSDLKCHTHGQTLALPETAYTYTQTGTQATLTNTTKVTEGFIHRWDWNLGDGTTSDKRDVVHTYSKHGDYTVSLDALDDSGRTTTFTDTVSIYQQLVMSGATMGSGNVYQNSASYYYYGFNVATGSGAGMGAADTIAPNTFEDGAGTTQTVNIVQNLIYGPTKEYIFELSGAVDNTDTTFKSIILDDGTNPPVTLNRTDGDVTYAIVDGNARWTWDVSARDAAEQQYIQQAQTSARDVTISVVV